MGKTIGELVTEDIAPGVFCNRFRLLVLIIRDISDLI